MITCSKCGKENQDHYKFCLGCGAELPRAAAAKPFTAATPPQGVLEMDFPLIAQLDLPLDVAYFLSPGGRYLMGEPASDDVRVYDVKAQQGGH